MKATLTLIAALALATTAATTLAQTPAPSPAESAECHGGKHNKHDGNGIFASLNLTPDQKAKIDVLLADLRSKTETILSNAALTPEQKKEQIRGLREANRTKIDAILTPDQLAQLQKAKADHKGGHHKHGGEAVPQASPAK